MVAGLRAEDGAGLADVIQSVAYLIFLLTPDQGRIFDLLRDNPRATYPEALPHGRIQDRLCIEFPGQFFTHVYFQRRPSSGY